MCETLQHMPTIRGSAKYWLSPLMLAANDGLSNRDLAAVRRIIVERRPQMLEAWREHCDARE